MEQVSVLGIDGAVHGGLLFLDDTDVQFVSGRCLVRYDTETRLQSAIPCSASAVAVTAVAVTANRR